MHVSSRASGSLLARYCTTASMKEMGDMIVMRIIAGDASKQSTSTTTPSLCNCHFHAKH